MLLVKKTSPVHFVHFQGLLRPAAAAGVRVGAPAVLGAAARHLAAAATAGDAAGAGGGATHEVRWPWQAEQDRGDRRCGAVHGQGESVLEGGQT